MADLKFTIRGMQALCQLAIDYGNGIVPHRNNQDVVEARFCHHRDMCGLDRNMSGMSGITIMASQCMNISDTSDKLSWACKLKTKMDVPCTILPKHNTEDITERHYREIHYTAHSAYLTKLEVYFGQVFASCHKCIIDAPFFTSVSTILTGLKMFLQSQNPSQKQEKESSYSLAYYRRGFTVLSSSHHAYWHPYSGLALYSCHSSA